MNLQKLEATMREAERFLLRAHQWREAELAKQQAYYTNPKESGAVRRASMDLTRSLADLRKPG